MVLGTQILTSLIQYYMTSIRMSLFDNEILTLYTVHTVSAAHDQFLHRSFVDIYECSYQLRIWSLVSIQTSEVELLP